MERYLLHKIELVYPPVSNQEAEWIKDVPEVQMQLQQSNLYMIGQRPEAFYRFSDSVMEQVLSNKKISFCFDCLDHSSYVEIDIPKLLEMYEYSKNRIEDVECEMGRKFIQLWIHDGHTKQILDWFTTEKLLHNRSRAHPAIHGIDDFSQYSKYYLHYVGISKEYDSLTRLVVKPHDKRLRILSNESPFHGNSRVTDEIVLFFFQISTLQINQYELDESDLIVENLNKKYDNRQRIIADAEKALIKILDTPYNIVKYVGYPRSIDGLFDEGIDRYGYFIGEEIEFNTDNNRIVGEYTPYEIGLRNKADLIFIEGEKVYLVRISEIEDE